MAPHVARRGAVPIHANAAMRLARVALSNHHQNAYHNHAHVWQVLTMAVILGRTANHLPADRWMLIIAALAHDLGHPGRRMRDCNGSEETAAIKRASRLLFRRGANGQQHRQLARMVMATAATTINDAKPHANRCPWNLLHDVDLLHDADLFASLAFGPSMQLYFARKIAQEQMVPLLADKILQQFLTSRQLKTSAAIKLARCIKSEI